MVNSPQNRPHRQVCEVPYVAAVLLSNATLEPFLVWLRLDSPSFKFLRSNSPSNANVRPPNGCLRQRFKSATATVLHQRLCMINTRPVLLYISWNCSIETHLTAKYVRPALSTSASYRCCQGQIGVTGGRRWTIIVCPYEYLRQWFNRVCHSLGISASLRNK